MLRGGVGRLVEVPDVVQGARMRLFASWSRPRPALQGVRRSGSSGRRGFVQYRGELERGGGGVDRACLLGAIPSNPGRILRGRPYLADIDGAGAYLGAVLLGPCVGDRGRHEAVNVRAWASDGTKGGAQYRGNPKRGKLAGYSLGLLLSGIPARGRVRDR